MLLCERHLFCPVCNKEQNRPSLPSDQNSTQGARWELWRWWSTLRGPVYKCVYDGEKEERERERGQLASPPTTFEWVFKLIYCIDLSFHTHTCLSIYCYLLLLLPFDYWFLLFDDFIVAFVSIHCTLIKCCFIFFLSFWRLLPPPVQLTKCTDGSFFSCLLSGDPLNGIRQSLTLPVWLTLTLKSVLSLFFFFFFSLSLSLSFTRSLPSSYSSMYY